MWNTSCSHGRTVPFSRSYMPIGRMKRKSQDLGRNGWVLGWQFTHGAGKVVPKWGIPPTFQAFPCSWSCIILIRCDWCDALSIAPTTAGPLNHLRPMDRRHANVGRMSCGKTWVLPWVVHRLLPVFWEDATARGADGLSQTKAFGCFFMNDLCLHFVTRLVVV